MTDSHESFSRAELRKLRSLKEAREAVEREMIQQALERHGGKISRAAEELGISRPTLYELLEKLGMDKPSLEKKES